MAESMDRTIGRYEIGELLGEGAMARVYRAFDPHINRSVAMKVLKDDFCEDEEYVVRFLREAKAAGALQHPNIVTVFDVGKLDNAPYTMLELLEGQDLGAVMKESGAMPLEKVLIIGIQLCKALDYAHAAGVVHRDIKPDNIIVAPDGISIKVADFGVARVSETDEAQKTQLGSVLGTPRYMAPEQARGEEIDGRADLFAVGLILYEALTGRKAFSASSLATLMTKIIDDQPTPIKELVPDAPAGTRQIIQKLIRKNPDKRYQSGDEVARALTKELSALREQQEEHGKHQYIPLKVRWALSMGLTVALVMVIAGSLVFNKLSNTLTVQAVDTGASFAKLVAIEMANPLLGEEWILVDTFIEEAASRETFSYLTVIDHSGIVRGSSDRTLIGQPFEVDSEQELISDKDDIRTTSAELPDGSMVFNITAPVTFQDTPVGSIVLGLSQDGLSEVKSTAASQMLALAAVTIAAVAVVLFVFGGRIGKPIKLVSKSMRSFGAGDMDVRISQTRNDEIGELFESFNAMAAAVQAGGGMIESGAAMDATGADASLQSINSSSVFDSSGTSATPAGGQKGFQDRVELAVDAAGSRVQAAMAAISKMCSDLATRVSLLFKRSEASNPEEQGSEDREPDRSEASIADLVASPPTGEEPTDQVPTELAAASPTPVPDASVEADIAPPVAIEEAGDVPVAVENSDKSPADTTSIRVRSPAPEASQESAQQAAPPAASNPGATPEVADADDKTVVKARRSPPKA